MGKGVQSDGGEVQGKTVKGSLGKARRPGGDSRGQAPSGGFRELVQESGAPGTQGRLGDVPRGSSEGTGLCRAPKAI